MSTGALRSTRSASRGSKRSESSMPAPQPSITPKNDESRWEPCAATGSFFLYAQRNVVLCLHHDTLAIERRFGGHREDISWIAADNVSERGAGRLVVSYDSGNTAICWDLFTGEEVARFASYEQIRVAAWMRNGNVAFGNSQGNVILFEPSTSEHISARTIFDPVTALAPAADCRTFAIGYQNGSILLATLQPFTILHTLTSTRPPSPIAGLAWHGSSAKQKSEMLATQTRDGDLRVWSIPKVSQGDPPCVIRVLGKTDVRELGPVWFSWSKMGRIVQVSEGQTYSWDVRTKRVTWEPVPTIDDMVGIANYGPTATLFTMGQNHTVQQYDINPQGTPALVAKVQHVPANTPPSPPNSIEDKNIPSDVDRSESSTPALPGYSDTTSSEGEGVSTMSPLAKIAKEMDALEEERRDHLGPLSPSSSRASLSSRSSGTSQRRRYRFEKGSSVTSKASGASSQEGTVFSLGSSLVRPGHESISIQSLSSSASSAGHYKPSLLRQEVTRKAEKAHGKTELFPFIKARLSEVPFKSPRYSAERTNDELRQQMLSVVFGWDGDVESLIRDELSRHPPASAGAVLLSKWLGELGADSLASMIGTESMTSSDWMLLALSSMGQDSQKKVGQAFVQRLLEKGDEHPAVAILLGLGEQNDAVEVYVSRKHYMEAVLLTCLLYPNDWKRQSFLVRKWGEAAVSKGMPELAVRCFSCTSLESAEAWTSPTAQDAVFAAQQESAFHAQLSPPLSPPGSGMPNRLKSSSLKLITNFGDKSGGNTSAADEQTPMNIGVTPIAESALSPGGAHGWLRPSRAQRDPSSARTATPGSYRRKRFPSKPDVARGGMAMEEIPIVAPPRRPTPQTAIDTRAAVDARPAVDTRKETQSEAGSHKRTTSHSSSQPSLATEPIYLSAVAYDPTKAGSKSTTGVLDTLPSPAVGVFNATESRSRNGSRSRKPEDLQLDLGNTIVREGIPTTRSIRSTMSPPPLTGASLSSLKSDKVRSIDEYISSLDEAQHYARQQRAESRRRDEPSRERKSRSRQPSESRSTGTGRVRYIKPAKRSPSSPVSMSPDDATLYSSNTESNTFQDERYYSMASPTDSRQGRTRSRSKPRAEGAEKRLSSKSARRGKSPEKRSGSKPASRNVSRNRSRQPSPEGSRQGGDRGRTLEPEGSANRSPSSPLPMSTQARLYREEEEAAKVEAAAERPRRSSRSRSRRPGERGSSARREKSPDRRIPRERSTSRRPPSRDPSVQPQSVPQPVPQPVSQPVSRPESPEARKGPRRPSQAGLPKLNTDLITEAAMLARKEAAARELEERRLSLARRPSAPVIPHPEELSRLSIANRSATDLSGGVGSTLPSTSYADRITRSQTVDPDAMNRYVGTPRFTTGISSPSAPIGLPATPRAMRHPRYMSADPQEGESIPAVPQLPRLSTISPVTKRQEADDAIPLLPATTYGIPTPRSASAPPEHIIPVRRGSISSNGSNHNRQPSGGVSNKRISPPIIASIDETLSQSDAQVVILEEGPAPPPILPELQHLSGPPVPPPPPSIFQPGHKHSGSQGVINIAIEENAPLNTSTPMVEVIPQPPPPPTTASPSAHRRGRASVSENIGNKLRQVTERMRSTSRSRNKSPPVQDFTPSPYESVIPPFNFPRRDSVSHAKSPSNESNPAAQVPPPPAVPAIPLNADGQPMEQVISPTDEKKNPNLFSSYMRNPKEIRANMPPASLQAGVLPPVEGGMI